MARPLVKNFLNYASSDGGQWSENPYIDHPKHTTISGVIIANTAKKSQVVNQDHRQIIISKKKV